MGRERARSVERYRDGASRFSSSKKFDDHHSVLLDLIWWLECRRDGEPDAIRMHVV